MRSLKLCLNSTLFTFNGILYNQTNEVVMEPSTSSIVANLFMSHIETFIFVNTIRLRIWLRYVNDTFVIIEIFLWTFSKLINTFLLQITFTLETENEYNELPFLDCVVNRNLNGTQYLTIYRKPTYSNRYINFNSAYPVVFSSSKSFQKSCLNNTSEKLRQ